MFTTHDRKGREIHVYHKRLNFSNITENSPHGAVRAVARVGLGEILIKGTTPALKSSSLTSSPNRVRLLYIQYTHLTP